MRIFLRIFFLSLFLLLALITFLLTPTGLRSSFWVAQKISSGKFSYHSVSGVWLGPIDIRDLHYEDQTQLIKIKKIHMDWRLGKLLLGTLRINNLHIEDVTFITKKNAPPRELTKDNMKKFFTQCISAWENKKSPWNVSIGHLNLQKLYFSNEKENSSLYIDQLFLASEFDHHNRDLTLLVRIKNPHQLVFVFKSHGNKNHYEIKSGFVGYHSNWLLTGSGNQDQLELHTTRNQVLNGTFNVNIKSAQQLSHWNGELHANNLNLALIDPFWSDPLSFDIVNHTTPDKMKTAINVRSPYGYVHFNIAHDNAWKTKWELNLLHLSHWMPSSSGNVQSRGKITGDWSNPQFEITAQGKLQSPQWHLTNFNIHFFGTRRDHHFVSTFSFPKQTALLKLDGTFLDNSWQGAITQLQVNMPNNEQWVMKKPTQITLAQNAFQMSPFCFYLNTSFACGQINLLHNQWSGYVRANVTQFDWIKLFIPAIDMSSGKFVANVVISGNQKKPVVLGTLSLNQSNITIPDFNITLNNANATVAEKKHELRIDAIAYSQQKPIKISGRINLDSPHLNLSLEMQSNHALMMNTKEYQIYMSSHLHVNIQGENVYLTGALDIPEAEIKPYDFERTVGLPQDDIVFIGLKVHPPKPVWFIHSDMTIHLGDKIHVDSEGLNAWLGGSLQLQLAPNQPLTGNGAIFVKQGTFSVYGKSLTVEKDSYISYNNNSLDNPTLNIRASKNIQTLTTFGGTPLFQGQLVAGIEVTGTLKSPRFLFYASDGNLSQVDILSYLLFGYGTSHNGPGNTDLLLSAISSMDITSQGLLGKQNIASQIEERLGISEMGVESNTLIDGFGNPLSQDSSFVIGKHLSKKFYMRYSFGLMTNSVDVFALQYFLNTNWALQLESSTLGNGADVLYTVER